MRLSARFAQIGQFLSRCDLPRSHSPSGETPSHVGATEQCVLTTTGGAEAPARKGEPHEREHQTRRCHSDAGAALEKQEGLRAAAAVTACGGQSGEVGLSILRQRRSRAVLQEATRCPMPRLLQETLRFGRAEEGEHPHSEGEGREVVSRQVTNGVGPGPSEGSGPGRLREVNQRMPSACCWALQSRGRSTRRVRSITVRSGGWRPVKAGLKLHQLAGVKMHQLSTAFGSET
jgi:hypothetical protein